MALRGSSRVILLSGVWSSMSHVTCHLSHVTCHMSHVTCHMSHFFLFFFRTKWWILSVKGSWIPGSRLIPPLSGPPCLLFYLFFILAFLAVWWHLGLPGTSVSESPHHTTCVIPISTHIRPTLTLLSKYPSPRPSYQTLNSPNSPWNCWI